MSKKTAYLLGILLTIIIGTLSYCYFCDTCHCSETTHIETALEDKVVETPITLQLIKEQSIQLTKNNII